MRKYNKADYFKAKRILISLEHKLSKTEAKIEKRDSTEERRSGKLSIKLCRDRKISLRSDAVKHEEGSKETFTSK